MKAFYDADHYVANAERKRFIANVMFEHTRFNVRQLGAIARSILVLLSGPSGRARFATPAAAAAALTEPSTQPDVGTYAMARQILSRTWPTTGWFCRRARRGTETQPRTEPNRVPN